MNQNYPEYKQPTAESTQYGASYGQTPPYTRDFQASTGLNSGTVPNPQVPPVSNYSQNSQRVPSWPQAPYTQSQVPGVPPQLWEQQQLPAQHVPPQVAQWGPTGNWRPSTGPTPGNYPEQQQRQPFSSSEKPSPFAPPSTGQNMFQPAPSNQQQSFPPQQFSQQGTWQQQASAGEQEVPNYISKQPSQQQEQPQRPVQGQRGSQNSGSKAHDRAAARARPVVSTGRRIDPSQVPTPARDLQTEFVPRDGSPRGIYYSGSATLPPYSISKFVCIDSGACCSPKFMRPTCTAAIHDGALMKECAVQLGVHLQPLNDELTSAETVPVVRGRAPMRCRRCRAYVSPNAAQFGSLGRVWSCLICEAENDVPEDFFANLDANGRRVDWNESPDISRSSVEYDVTNIEAYAHTDPLTKRIIPARPLNYLFFICVSRDITGSLPEMLSDYVNALRVSLRRMAQQFPMCSVSFLTYAKTLHFYNFSHPQVPVMIMADTGNPFVPLPFTLLCWLKLGEDMDKIETFLDNVPQYAAECDEGSECAMGAAITAASLILSDTGGKVVITASGVPSEGAGALRLRDVDKLYGTEKEKELFHPVDGFYTETAISLAKKQISCDIFMFSSRCVDIVTISQLCRLTGGSLQNFFNYRSSNDSKWLFTSVQQLLGQEQGYAAELRVRCSTGLTVTRYSGNFLSVTPLDMDLAFVGGNSAFYVELAHESQLDPKRPVHIQCVLLYTTGAGERRIRVHTLTLPVCNSYIALFRNLDLEATILSYVRQAVSAVMNDGPGPARRALFDRLVKMLVAYRKHCSTGSHTGQLLMPELLKLLPVFCLALMKCGGFAPGTQIRIDDRAQSISDLNCMSAARLMPYLYPRFYALHNLYAHPEVGVVSAEDASTPDVTPRISMPPLMQLTADTVMNYGVYLLYDQQAHLCFLWIGSQVSEESSRALFNSNNAAEVGRSIGFEAFTSRLQAILRYVMEVDLPPYLKDLNREGLPGRLSIVHERKDVAEEDAFFRNMIEDSNVPGVQSYSDLLCSLHKVIGQQLNL